MTSYDIEIDRGLSFEEFLRMPSNAPAHMAARGIADGELENSPLCVYSEAGCGKTHLLNAIANQYRKMNPDKRVVLTSVERMIDNYVTALQNGSLADFRAHYRTADMLLVDDLEMLERSKQFEAEMYSTLNVVFETRMPVVFASNQNPQRMSISYRLTERITKGLTVKIDGLTKGERFEFLKYQFMKARVSILDSNVSMMADAISGNASELVRAVKAVKFVSAGSEYEATHANVCTALESCGIIKS